MKHEWWLIAEDSGVRVAGPFATMEEAADARRKLEDEQEAKWERERLNLWIRQAEELA